MLLNLDIVKDQKLHDQSVINNARVQAAILIDKYGSPWLGGEDTVPVDLVKSIISGLFDQVEKETGTRPTIETMKGGIRHLHP